MAKYYVMGNYTTQTFRGFISNPKQDRTAGATAFSEAVGGKMEFFPITKVTYDFLGVVSGNLGFEAQLLLNYPFKLRANKISINFQSLWLEVKYYKYNKNVLIRFIRP